MIIALMQGCRISTKGFCNGGGQKPRRDSGKDAPNSGNRGDQRLGVDGQMYTRRENAAPVPHLDTSGFCFCKSIGAPENKV